MEEKEAGKGRMLGMAGLHPGYLCSNLILTSKVHELPRAHGGRGDTGRFFLKKPVRWPEEVRQLSAEAGMGKQDGFCPA